MTVQAVIETHAPVSSCDLGDGRLVRLTGNLGDDDLVALREALLSPLPDHCRDLVLDAGDVTGVSDDAVAVLIAAPLWAESHGSRMLMSRSAVALDETLDALELADALPRLTPLQSAPPALPRPRLAVD